MRKNRKVRFKLGVILKLTEFFIEEEVICFEVAKLFNAGTPHEKYSLEKDSHNTAIICFLIFS